MIFLAGLLNSLAQQFAMKAYQMDPSPKIGLFGFIAVLFGLIIDTQLFYLSYSLLQMTGIALIVFASVFAIMNMK